MSYIDKTIFVTIPTSDSEKINPILDHFSSPKTDAEIFYNLCFTLMAPQTTFKSNRFTIDELIRLNYYENDLSANLPQIVKKVRFLNVKAKRLEDMKAIFRSHVLPVIRSNLSWREKRYWIYDHINGFGLKAASHFLRNIGCRELPIIDTHIVKFLMAKKPSNIVQYMALETEFVNICKEKNVEPAALDAYIWKEFSETDYSTFDY